MRFCLSAVKFVSVDHVKVNGLKVSPYVRLYLSNSDTIMSTFFCRRSFPSSRAWFWYIHMVFERQEIFRALNSSLPSLLSPLCPLSSPPLSPPPHPLPLWVSSWWCVRGWGDDEECCCCDLEGGSDSSTYTRTEVCTHMEACATQPDVWQIALLRLCKISMVAQLQVDCQFLPSRGLRNVLLLSM